MKDVRANIKNILKFEYPKTFKFNKSLLFLKCNRNHMLEIKIINGNNLINIFGIYKAVSVIGVNIEAVSYTHLTLPTNREV